MDERPVTPSGAEVIDFRQRRRASDDSASEARSAGPEPVFPGREVSKQDMLVAALERGRVMVRVDARRRGVRVPEKYLGDSGLALNVSWRFPHAAMVVNDRGVAATLHFAGTAFRCQLPWSAVWGLVLPGGDELYVWPDDLPEDLGGPKRGEEAEPLPVEPVRPRLEVLSGDEPPPPPRSDPTEPHSAAPGGRPSLRLVR